MMGKDEPGSKGNRKQDYSRHSKNLALIRVTEAERKAKCSVCKGAGHWEGGAAKKMM